MKNYLGRDLISIIVPIYKVEAYLNQCVESLVNQTYSNLEIILVDDGSPDLCGEICNQWAMRDSRIVVIHQKNRGLAGARNAGLNCCSGKYLMFVDSDDYVEPTYVEKLYESITVHQADMAICGFCYLSTDGGREERCLLPKEGNEKGRIEALLGLESSGQRKIIYTVMWNKIFRRELWNELCFPNVKMCEDEYVMPYIYERCRKVALVDEVLYVYRRRVNSITAVCGEEFQKAQLAFMAEREVFYKEIGAKELLVLQQIHLYGMYNLYGIDDKEKKKQLQRNLRYYYATYDYVTKIPWSRKAKNMFAVLNIALYQKVVNCRALCIWIHRG